MMTNHFKYGLVCMVISIVVCAVAIVSLSHTLDMVALIVFMVGLALLVEVDF